MMNLQKQTGTLMGLLFVALLAVASYFIAEIGFVKSLALSPLIIGVVLGLIGANTIRSRLPESYTPGLRICSKLLLRGAIIFYGFRLSIEQLITVGSSAFWVDLIIVVGTIFWGLLFGRLMRMDRDLTLLTSSGSAICGAAAVLATEPVLKAESYKTVVAVSTVVIFGTISMFLYPILAKTGFLSDLTTNQLGVYIGSTIHEVAHAVGAGNAVSEEVAHTATISKMLRVVLLVPFLLILSVIVSKSKRKPEDAHLQRSRISIPWFAILFLVVIALNSGILALVTGTSYLGTYNSLVSIINHVDTFALTMAMVAIGLDASFSKFKQAGFRPFMLALLLDLWLVFGGYLLVKLLV